ncbi:MAG: GntR family transcriptional regulator [Acholeplasmataceae bacterium]|jgi:GntR family transcriptional regulator|nr:GntR family transcriptional regulator [Acholeplasmataceae bacterium]
MMTFPYEKIKVDRRSAQPISLQLAQSIKVLITNNELSYQNQLPQLNDMSTTLMIRKTDIEKAYQMLVDEKFLLKKNHEYTINYFHFSANFFLDVIPLFEAIRLMGMTPKMKTISIKRQLLPTELKLYSKISADEKHWAIKRLYYGNDIPLVILESFLPESKFPDLDKIINDNEPLYEALFSRYQTRITSSNRIFKVINLDKDSAHHLHTIPGSASYQGLSLAYDPSHNLVDITRSWSIINYFFEIEYNRQEIEKVMSNHLYFI